jgi:hypothetical protein
MKWSVVWAPSVLVWETTRCRRIDPLPIRARACFYQCNAPSGAKRSPSGHPLAEDLEAYATWAWPPWKEGVAHHCRNHMDERSLVLVPTDWAKRNVYGNTCQEDGLFSFTSSDSSTLIRWRRRSLIRWWRRLAPLPVAEDAPWSRTFRAWWFEISLISGYPVYAG